MPFIPGKPTSRHVQPAFEEAHPNGSPSNKDEKMENYKLSELAQALDSAGMTLHNIPFQWIASASQLIDLANVSLYANRIVRETTRLTDQATTPSANGETKMQGWPLNPNVEFLWQGFRCRWVPYTHPGGEYVYLNSLILEARFFTDWEKREHWVILRDWKGDAFFRSAERYQTRSQEMEELMVQESGRSQL